MQFNPLISFTHHSSLLTSSPRLSFYIRYVDLSEAIDSEDASFLDNSEFTDTDAVPLNTTLPTAHYLVDEVRHSYYAHIHTSRYRCRYIHTNVHMYMFIHIRTHLHTHAHSDIHTLTHYIFLSYYYNFTFNLTFCRPLHSSLRLTKADHIQNYALSFLS